MTAERTDSKGQEGEQGRGKGVVIDLERLEAHAKALYLTRFIEAVKAARGTHGRYLVLRSGDELAIKAAEDGSGDVLQEVRVEQGETEPG
jgi:hypothetical protein